MKLFDIIDEDNSSDLKQLKTDAKKKSTEDVYAELIDMLQSKDYSDSVEFIEDLVKDPKLKFILSLGFGGEYADTDLTIKKIVKPVGNFIPTQNEIGSEETLKYICADGKNVELAFKTPAVIKKPIVSFRSTFIVDGHHRWSEIYAINKNAKIECIDIDGDLSPIQILKAIQATIGSNIGTLNPKDVQGKNLFELSEKQIKDYLEKNMTDKAKEILTKHYENPIEEIVKNCMILKNNNHPIIDAPDRGEMPQTSKDPELFKDLDNGITKI